MRCFSAIHEAERGRKPYLEYTMLLLGVAFSWGNLWPDSPSGRHIISLSLVGQTHRPGLLLVLTFSSASSVRCESSLHPTTRRSASTAPILLRSGHFIIQRNHPRNPMVLRPMYPFRLLLVLLLLLPIAPIPSYFRGESLAILVVVDIFSLSPRSSFSRLIGSRRRCEAPAAGSTISWCAANECLRVREVKLYIIANTIYLGSVITARCCSCRPV